MPLRSAVIASALDELTLKSQFLKNRPKQDEKHSLVLAKPINFNAKFLTTNNSVRESLEPRQSTVPLDHSNASKSHAHLHPKLAPNMQNVYS